MESQTLSSEKTLGSLCKLASFLLCSGYSILLTACSTSYSEAMSRAGEPSPAMDDIASSNPRPCHEGLYKFEPPFSPCS